MIELGWAVGHFVHVGDFVHVSQTVLYGDLLMQSLAVASGLNF